MQRRDFLGFSLAAAGLVFAPKLGRWHRQGSGLFVPTGPVEYYINEVLCATQPRGEMTNVFYPPVSGLVTVKQGGRPIAMCWHPDGIVISKGDTLTIDWRPGPSFVPWG